MFKAANCLSLNITKFPSKGAKSLFVGFTTLQVHGLWISNTVVSRVSLSRGIYRCKYQAR